MTQEQFLAMWLKVPPDHPYTLYGFPLWLRIMTYPWYKLAIFGVTSAVNLTAEQLEREQSKICLLGPSKRNKK